jgi:hypothetical protein
MRRERERLVIRDSEHNKAAATVACGGVDLVEVADEELLLLARVLAWAATLLSCAG